MRFENIEIDSAQAYICKKKYGLNLLYFKESIMVYAVMQKISYIIAVKDLSKICTESKMPTAEVGYGWLAYHLPINQQEEDGIIIRASSKRQLEQNLQTVEKGPLPENIINAFDSAWKQEKPDSLDNFNSK